MAAFLEIDHGSALYEQSLALRDEVLRAPLGMSLAAEDLSGEANERHFGLIEEGQILACLVIAPLSSSAVKLRQMAVSANQQGQGLGKALVTAVEELLKDEAMVTVELHGRQEAATFCSKLGYRAVGEPFIEVGIPHIKMTKQL